MSSVTSKLFEHVLLERFRGILTTCEQQFGFKRSLGCAECSFVLKETIDYYLSNGNKEILICLCFGLVQGIRSCVALSTFH